MRIFTSMGQSPLERRLALAAGTKFAHYCTPLLRAVGFHAEAYADGYMFLAAAETRPPDCVVADLHMQTMTGIQLLLHVRKMKSPPPVLVRSAS
jgi:FixJ family two-component response regulator